MWVYCVHACILTCRGGVRVWGTQVPVGLSRPLRLRWHSGWHYKRCMQCSLKQGVNPHKHQKRQFSRAQLTSIDRPGRVWERLWVRERMWECVWGRRAGVTRLWGAGLRRRAALWLVCRVSSSDGQRAAPVSGRKGLTTTRGEGSRWGARSICSIRQGGYSSSSFAPPRNSNFSLPCPLG